MTNGFTKMTPQGSINYWQLGQNLSFQIKFQISQTKKKIKSGKETHGLHPRYDIYDFKVTFCVWGAGFRSHGLLVKYCQKSQGEAHWEEKVLICFVDSESVKPGWGIWAVVPPPSEFPSPI